MKNLLISFIVFLVSLSVATLIGYGSGYNLSINNPFILLTLLAFLIQWIAFIPAAILKTEKFYDLSGSLTYLLCTITALTYFSTFNTRSLILSFLVFIWASRLGTFLFFRIVKAGKDSRFDEIKKSPSRFFITWTLQGLWVSLTSCAAWAGIINSPTQPEIGIIGWAGLGVWILGFSFEVIADKQKSVFKDNTANKGKFITTGLWSLCRHPNYFGEIVLWIGVFIISTEILTSTSWVCVISPVFVYLLLTKISGVPLLTKQAQERWGDDPKWQEYFNSTPVLFPKFL